jgi:hypothetical protein
MAKYPNEIYEPRKKENRPGVTYDPNKKTVLFAEDIKALDDEVVAIETELGTNPKGEFSSVKERLDKLTAGAIVPFKKGRWVYAPIVGSTASTSKFAHTLYCFAFLVPIKTSFDKIGIRVQTAYAGGLIRVGVYKDRSDIWPGDLISGTEREFSADTSGDKIADIDITLEPGIYWLALLQNASINLLFRANAYLFAPLGSSSPIDRSMNTVWRSFTYGSLPASFGDTGTIDFSDVPVALRVKP